MSVTDALTRIAEIESLLAPRPPASAAGGRDASIATGGAVSFADLLSRSGPSAAPAALGTPGALTLPAAAGGTGAGARMVALAEAEVGQSEQPPGSNDSPRIAEYRAATAGSGIGPWCAYFASWAARQAGAPLGEAGQGFGSVDAVAAWAQRSGRWTPAGAGAPQPGDLVVWGGRHIGIVESVGADGAITTVEGNSSDAVSRRSYGPGAGGATGFVRVG